MGGTSAEHAVGAAVSGPEGNDLLFRNLARLAADAIILADDRGVITFWNQAAECVFGYHEHEIVGRPLTVIMPSRYRERHLQGLAHHRSTGESTYFGSVHEYHGLRKDGREFPVDIAVSSWNAHGRTVFAAVVRDTTDRKVAEEKLRASEQHFQKLFHQAREMERSLRKLSQKAIHVQEEERRRVSRELHDEVGQALAAISVNLDSVKRGLQRGSAPRKRLTDAQHLVGQTVRNLQRVCHDLHPAILDHLGLISALRWYAKTFSERTAIKVQLKVTGDPGPLAPEQRLMVYRIVQEGLTNTLKHSKATHANIEMEGRPGVVSLSIHDDGKGFRVGRGLSTSRRQEGLGGLGLLGIQERVRLAGGSFEVESARGKGTTIRVEVAVRAAREKPRPALRKKHR